MEYLTVNEAAEVTGVEPAAIRALCRNRLIEAYDDGNRWVIPERAVDKIVAAAEEAEAAIEEGQAEMEEDEDDEEDEGYEEDE